MNQNVNFFLKYKFSLLALIVVLLSIIASINYFNFIQSKKEALALNTYKANVVSMKKNLLSRIEQKESATVAMALSMSAHNDVSQMIKNGHFRDDTYEKLIHDLRLNTLYKNIWIHIIDKNGLSLYRSWTDKKNDNVLDCREDIATVLHTHKFASFMSVGEFNLSLKAIVPILKDKKLIGAIEVISHLNSISKELKKLDIDSVIIVNEKNSKKIKYPFTNIYVDNYYIANFDAKPKLRKYIQAKGVRNFLTEGYKIGKNYLIVSYALRDNKSKIIGSYVMFKKISKIPTASLNFFIFKLISLFILIFMIVIILVTIFLYNLNKKQKEYYKNIIDSSRNLVIVHDEDTIISVNKVFFKYFDKYRDLEEFRSEYACICELFANEEGYLQKTMDDESWIKYLARHSGKRFKVKILFFEKTYYFAIAASLISKHKNHYSVILSDVTKEENYKQKLERLTITDTLTQIGNRRYFQTRIDEEMAKAHRHKHELSLIIFDIDNFKNVNDVYGHSVGDEVLVEYSRFITSKLRSGDELCRIGGEEFIIIVPHTGIDSAFILAEKLRKDIELHKKIIPITVSFGVTQYIYGENVEDIFKRVDKALYMAKESGRNKVVLG